MHVLCDIAMLLIHFHTLLIIFGLTYKLSAPQCQFLFSVVFLYQVFPLLKMPEKFQEKYIKNQRRRTFQKSQSGARGPPPGAQAPCGRGLGGGRARGPPGPLVAPLAAPLRLFILRDGILPKTEPFFVISPLFHRRSASKIGSIRRPLPGTLPEGGITSGSFSTTMDAFRMSCE